MADLIRCPSCRGAKKVPKLGGIIGECNTCSGKGQIKAIDKPVKVDPIVQEDVISKELINAVADSIPVSKIEPKPIDVKVDGKKALYRRKKA